MTEVWIVFGVALVPWAALTFLRLKRFLHILQLEEYETTLFLNWLRLNVRRYAFSHPSILLGGLLLSAVLAWTYPDDPNPSDIGPVAWNLTWGLLAIGYVLLDRRQSALRPRPKKPLVVTPRARRILVVSFCLGVGFSAMGCGIALALDGSPRLAVWTVVFAVCWLAGLLVALANVLLWPLEERSRRRFQTLAAAKLAAQRPRVIAITGSAGKTTTKELVAHLLSARYRVLKTPASFNTPLGIARTVNDSLDGQEYFVVEMGAYRRGEIERLCRLVGGTDVSVITTVNAQHLQRFGSLAATAQAKFEIVEGLKPGGTAVLNFDVAAVREQATDRGLVLRGPQDEREGAGLRQAQDERGTTLLSFGVESDDVELRASNVVETEAGIELDVSYRGETMHFVTQLLARHNATNVLAAVAVGLSCGLDLGYMAAAVRQFRPPEHRLQPTQLDNGVTVLDDAYNANPEGIIGALEVLGRYAPRRRIIVTPGLIEMGREKAAYHARIGRAAAQNVDVAVLVGPKQTADIKDAMLAASFPAERLHVVRGLDEAREVLARFGAPGDVILYANDLPDQFDEFLVI